MLGYLRAVDVTLSNFGKLGTADTFLMWADAGGIVKFVNGRWMLPANMVVGVFDGAARRSEDTAFTLVVADLYAYKKGNEPISVWYRIGLPSVSISNVAGDCYERLLMQDGGTCSLRNIYADVRNGGGELVTARNGVEAVSVGG